LFVFFIIIIFRFSEAFALAKSYGKLLCEETSLLNDVVKYKGQSAQSGLLDSSLNNSSFLSEKGEGGGSGKENSGGGEMLSNADEGHKDELSVDQHCITPVITSKITNIRGDSFGFGGDDDGKQGVTLTSISTEKVASAMSQMYQVCLFILFFFSLEFFFFFFSGIRATFLGSLLLLGHRQIRSCCSLFRKGSSKNKYWICRKVDRYTHKFYFYFYFFFFTTYVF
jgi:hypothetical protein